MENIRKIYRTNNLAETDMDDNNIWNDYEEENGPCAVEKEMGIHRRKRRSLHGRELIGKVPLSTSNNSIPKNIFASCLDISDEYVIDSIMEGCTNVEEMIRKLKEQRISLTKKRCIKAKLTPVEQSKILKLSYLKKLKYRMGISYNKLKIGFRNFLYTFELWYSSLKMIEGKFGSSVATYFKFLRKLFILNCILFLLNFFFIILPHVMFVQVFRGSLSNDNYENTSFEINNSSDITTKLIYNVGSEKREEEDFFFFSSYSDVSDNHLRLGNLFTGMGYLADSVLFYGHYLNSSFSLISTYSYDMPSAYFFSIAFCYFLVLCVLFFSVAESYKKNYIETSGGGQNIFSEKIFCGWDFGIAKSDAEELKYCSIYMELKELLNESSKSNKYRNFIDGFFTLMIRLSLNMIFLLLLAALGWYASSYLNIHMDNADVPTIMMLTLTLTLVTTLAPVGFSWLAKFEYYENSRTDLYVSLVRTFILHVIIIVIIVAHRLSSASKIPCWETVVGQDVYRLIILDFFVEIGGNMIEFIRYRLSKICERIERPEFNIALNTMKLIYNQALLYVGLYFSPGLSLIVSLKMFLTFYLKKWGAMYNCQPSKKPRRAAHTQTVLLSFAFLVFFSVIVTYGYIFTSVKTSSCGPFGGEKIVFEAVLYEILHDGINSTSLLSLSHFLRSGVVVIMLLAMILAIYYLRSVNSVRRHIVQNLKSIVREQVAYKKNLLMKIKKAQEESRHNRLPKIDTSIILHRRDEDSSSDPDDRGEDIPLRKKSENVEECHSLRTRRHLSKSSFNLTFTNEINSGPSSKNLALSRSLQSLSTRTSLGFNPELSPVNGQRIKHSKNSIHRMETTIEEPGEEMKRCNITVHSDTQRKCDEEMELSSLPSRRSFNYDERIPSRIYFDRNKRGKR